MSRSQCNKRYNISTHALTEGDAEQDIEWAVQDISTHALTEGDTDTTGSRQGREISTHALTEGDTGRDGRGRGRGHFNSRPHGGRHHNPICLDCQHHFNSRPHGGRPGKTRLISNRALFQLTPSRRATIIVDDSPEGKSYFNSRPHGGRRDFITFLMDFVLISTHALTEGD